MQEKAEDLKINETLDLDSINTISHDQKPPEITFTEKKKPELIFEN